MGDGEFALRFWVSESHYVHSITDSECGMRNAGDIIGKHKHCMS